MGTGNRLGVQGTLNPSAVMQLKTIGKIFSKFLQKSRTRYSLGVGVGGGPGEEDSESPTSRLPVEVTASLLFGDKGVWEQDPISRTMEVNCQPKAN